MFNFSSFDEFMKFKNWQEEEKKKIESKNQPGVWRFVAIYTFLGCSFPIILGLTVLSYNVAKHYASLF